MKTEKRLCHIPTAVNQHVHEKRKYLNVRRLDFQEMSCSHSCSPEDIKQDGLMIISSDPEQIYVCPAQNMLTHRQHV